MRASHVVVGDPLGHDVIQMPAAKQDEPQQAFALCVENNVNQPVFFSGVWKPFQISVTGRAKALFAASKLGGKRILFPPLIPPLIREWAL